MKYTKLREIETSYLVMDQINDAKNMYDQINDDQINDCTIPCIASKRKRQRGNPEPSIGVRWDSINNIVRSSASIPPTVNVCYTLYIFNI